MKRVLLSIRPEFAQKIFHSDKTVELRKRIPPLSAGDEIVVYASSPTKAIIGIVEVVEILRDNPTSLWKIVKKQAGITLQEYEAYYRGHNTAFGILLGRTSLFREQIPLVQIRKGWPGFNPPQSYMYVFLDAQDRNVLFTEEVSARLTYSPESTSSYQLHL